MTEPTVRKLQLSDRDSWIGTLFAGDCVLLSGVVYTARDAVHKKWMERLKSGEPLPLDLSSAAVYYAGPTPAPDGLPIGSCGPTTSSRMDVYYPALAERGLRITIGKGDRSEEVRRCIAKTGGVYFCAVGGAGALCAAHITAAEVIAYEELGCESMKRLVFSEMPLYVAIDSRGNSIFDREGGDK